MATHDNTHSWVVAWLKIVLPLLALAILSTLFLVSRTIDPSDAIPYATVDVDELVREPRITAPTYAGVTSDGAALTVSAAEARPRSADAAGATALHAALETPDGARTDVIAAQGSLDAANKLVRLEGGVRITSSSGYEIATDTLVVELGKTAAESAGAIEANGPLGHLTAGRFTLTMDPAVAGAYLLVFKDRVKLVYQPAK